MVCLAHEQNKEGADCDSLRDAIESLTMDYGGHLREYDLLDELSEFCWLDLSESYRLISEEDWELLEEAKKQKDKEREFVSRFQPVKTPEVLGWPNFVNKNIDVINRDMGKPIKSKK
jgi:hypothetical protein